ncbi:MAG: DUF2252 domain-containing protein [Leptospirales bacterium]
MKEIDAVDQILKFNQGLDPRRLKLKFKAMRDTEFAFLRGTCHLFYQALPPEPALDSAPLAWISGDLHLENFGSYKGNNRLTYFDLNDFDEACLAPCTWELLRFLSSVLTGAPALKLSEPDAVALCRHFLDIYRDELATGKSKWIERPLATGRVRELLSTLKKIDRSQFLDTRTRIKDKRRTLLVDGKKAFKTPRKERKEITDYLHRFARTQNNPDFYTVLDIADRISGLGSLGVKRYVVLIEGRGSPDENFLLDIKEARPSDPAALLPFPQPEWTDDAERVVMLQRQIQAIPPALLTTVRIMDKSFMLKELQPSEHRVNLTTEHGKIKRLKKVIETMGELTAWGQLRASGWRGSADRERLIAFAKENHWRKPVLELARQRSLLMKRYWQAFSRAYDDGAFSGYDDPRE